MSELEVLGAFLWEQAGRRPASAKDLAVILSFDLRWFRADEAKEVVSSLVAAGILVEEGEKLVAAGDLVKIEVPRGFRPSANFLGKAKQAQVAPLLDRILGSIPPRQDEGRSALLDETQRAAVNLGVSIEGAALLVAWRRGIRDAALLTEYEMTLLKDRPDDEN